MRRRKTPPGVIVLDLRPVVAAFQQIAAAAQAAIKSIQDLFDPAAQLAVKRARVGGNGTEARLEPDLWQSVECSAWLHVGCRGGDLGCHCRCHQ